MFEKMFYEEVFPGQWFSSNSTSQAFRPETSLHPCPFPLGCQRKEPPRRAGDKTTSRGSSSSFILPVPRADRTGCREAGDAGTAARPRRAPGSAGAGTAAAETCGLHAPALSPLDKVDV